MGCCCGCDCCLCFFHSILIRFGSDWLLCKYTHRHTSAREYFMVLHCCVVSSSSSVTSHIIHWPMVYAIIIVCMVFLWMFGYGVCCRCRLIASSCFRYILITLCAVDLFFCCTHGLHYVVFNSYSSNTNK